MTLNGHAVRSAARCGAALVVMGAGAACAHAFSVSRLATPTAAYAAGLEEYRKRHWENAASAFDHAINLLPPRDTLLPIAHYYLGQAYVHRKSYLLAADAFKRLYEGFPDDTLADDALLALGDAYRRQWRGPSFDPVKAVQALDAYSTLQRVYPDSPLAPIAEAKGAEINDALAKKDYDNGMFYFRRGGYISAVIYFQDVVKDYPGTKTARQAQLMMVEAYRRLKYTEDLIEMCNTLRAVAADDAAVRKACAGVKADTT
jgi:outer membrane protein assembly factor BamD